MLGPTARWPRRARAAQRPRPVDGPVARELGGEGENRTPDL